MSKVANLPMYDPTMVAPMREEVTEIGFQELKSASEVDQALGQMKGTALVFVNSVCGCAAGGARPGLRIAVTTSEKKPDNLYTVFAGMERDAVDKARGYLVGFAPSSPAIALMRDGEVVFMLERHHIEGHMPEVLGNALKQAFDEFC